MKLHWQQVEEMRADLGLGGAARAHGDPTVERAMLETLFPGLRYVHVRASALAEPHRRRSGTRRAEAASDRRPSHSSVLPDRGRVRQHRVRPQRWRRGSRQHPVEGGHEQVVGQRGLL
jgi:hypothetical protein